ncbi:uncharacterized protein LOC115927963 [Strongylocentrotus purpuratus]|uniref:Uncharacterized protein n=1 Tax=Strongylocentrotus purpuratus TaxID=7668 RepID=A0A7M7T331_STRPU|nr:uncharacterized protein LOC115927963 [Strongylocentrotus purpuratus]
MEKVKIETLVIWSDRLRHRRSASRDLAQFICKMPRLKNMSLGGQYHDDFYSTLSSMPSSAKVDVPCKDDVDLRPQSSSSSSSSRLGRFISKIPGVKRWKKSRSKSHRHNAESSGACAQQSVLKDDQSGNTSPTLTELTVGGDTLEGWQDCGSMFDNVRRVTIQVRSTINYDVFQMILIPGATELTIQTYEYVRRPADFHEDPTSLPSALLNISPQLVKVTFSDLDIGNNKMGQILLAFRSPHNLKDLKTIRFIRCGTDESMDDFTSACNTDPVVEVEHGKPRGESLLTNMVDDTSLDLITQTD